MKVALLVCLSFVLLPNLHALAQSVRTRPPEVTGLIAQLPECSTLRRDLEGGWYGDGISKPYMQSMLDHGVRRAYFEFEGKWRHNHAENIQIVRRVYFKQFDGPGGAITDPDQLRRIESNGLQATLDKAVLTSTANTRLFPLHDLITPWFFIGQWGWMLKGSKVTGSIELFASAWPPNFNYVTPGRRRRNLVDAAYVGDVIDLSSLLRERRHSQSELNWALNGALMSRRDNTAAIDQLVKAGADVNAKFGDNATPLMLTYESACDIPILLADGARLDDHDKWGQTAYDKARQRHDPLAIRLLQNPTEH